MRVFVAALCVFLAALQAERSMAEDIFTPIVGVWATSDFDGKAGLKVDGSQHMVSAEEHFPIAAHAATENFREGTITVQFKPIAGKSDQAGGIFFDRKDNGDYLVIRANALENNLNLYSYSAGRRSPIKEVDNAPAPAGVWHELKLVVSGNQVQGYLDGKLLLTYDLGRAVSGGVGLWSKDDSVAMFKDFRVASGKQ